MEPRHHALYRFYGDDGTLLYVGITNNPSTRFTEHSTDKPWWHEVRGITVEPYPDRDSVRAAETRAIAVESPRYNRQRPSLPGPSGRDRRRELVWICEACRLSIADGAGYIHIQHTRVNDVRQAEQAWHAEHDRPSTPGGLTLTPASAWLDFPTPARWQVHHAACDPEPESFDYHFDVARARTHAQLIQRTVHLLDKRWMKFTDWLELIERMSRVDL